MPVAEMYRVNYFVGALLAQGGNLWFEESKIIFSPTSAIDRAMGAENVDIPFQSIRGIEYAGGLSRSFNIKTDDKIHKFEGSQARQVWELLDKKLGSKGQINGAKQTSSLTCNQCENALQPGYRFCPHCGTRPKTICQSCQKAVQPNWVACAFCGSKFNPNKQQSA